MKLKMLTFNLFVLTTTILLSQSDPKSHPTNPSNSHSLPRAGSLMLEPPAAEPGDLVHATGAGWITIFEICEYRLFFDGLQVAQQGPDVRLFNPPNMTFIVPKDAEAGRHAVCVQLRRTEGHGIKGCF